MDYVASAQIQVKSYTAVRRKFQGLPTYQYIPGLPAPDPPVYYLRATVDATTDLDQNPGTLFERRRQWRRFGSITVDPTTMRPTGTYTAIFEDHEPLYETDLTYTFAYSWTDGVPGLEIAAEGTLGGNPVQPPEGEGACPPYLEDAEFFELFDTTSEPTGISEPFLRVHVGTGSETYDRLVYEYDEAGPGGSYTRTVRGTAELSQEFTTDLLNELAEQSLDAMPSLHLPWPTLPWELGMKRTWPNEYCGIEHSETGGRSWAYRRLHASQDHTLDLARAKFRFRVNATEAGKVYALRWKELFTPGDSNPTAPSYEYKTVTFVGTGGTLYLGVPADGAAPGEAYATLAGPDQTDDFTLDPPPYQQGNGQITVAIADYDLPLRFKVDLDIDADYDGAITEDDDPIETDPGGLVGVNDDMLNAIQDRLVPIDLRIEPADGLAGEAELVVHAPSGRIRLWTSPDMQTEATTLVWDLGNGDTLPATLYVEGLSVSTSPKDVALTLMYDDESNEDPSVEDRVVLTVARADLLLDINQDGTFDAADDALEATAPGKILNLATDTREELQLGLLPHAWREAGTSLLLHASDPLVLRVFDPSGAQIIGPETGDAWTQPVDEIDGYLWPATFAVEGAAFGETTLTLTLTDGAGESVCRDVAQLAALKVDSVEWVAVDSPIDDNPKWNGGKRIFPAKADPADTTPRNTVRVKATVTPALQDVTLYFNAFDVDDPTPASHDTTSTIDTNGDSGNDNHGSPGAGTLSAASATTDSSGEATVDFTVTMQPGDNFRVAVACDQQALNQLTVNDSSNPQYVTPDNQQISAFSGAVSPMLTAWRRLWLEFDSMGPALPSGAEKNFDEGTIDSLQTGVPATGQSTLNLSTKLTDEKNRYEEGFITIDGTKYPVVSNTDNLLFDDDVVITGTPGSGVVGKSFKIYDDDSDMGTAQHIRPLPYTLSGGSLIDSAYAEAYIKPENVPATYVDTDSTFYRNLSSGLFPGWFSKVTAKKDLNDSTDFWLAHLLAAWQGKTGEDMDPDTADPGDPAPVATNGEAVDSDNTGAIYIETIREAEILAHFPRIHEEHTVVHEIGHQGGGEHTDGGIMDYGAPIAEDHFSPTTIKRFREETTF